jgi:ERCC4-type nuclease
MRTFRSIEDIIAATPEELAAIPEIPARQAQEIWDFLHHQEKADSLRVEEQNPAQEE